MTEWHEFLSWNLGNGQLQNLHTLPGVNNSFFLWPAMSPKCCEAWGQKPFLHYCRQRYSCSNSRGNLSGPTAERKKCRAFAMHRNQCWKAQTKPGQHAAEWWDMTQGFHCPELCRILFLMLLGVNQVQLRRNAFQTSVHTTENSSGDVGVPEATGTGTSRPNLHQPPQQPGGTRTAAGEWRTKVEQMPSSQTSREVRRGQIKDFTT